MQSDFRFFVEIEKLTVTLGMRTAGIDIDFWSDIIIFLNVFLREIITQENYS